MKWISCENKLPKEGEIVIAYPGYIGVSIGTHTIKQAIHELIFYKGMFFDWRDSPICCGLNQVVYGITHWMPLPEPPLSSSEEPISDS